MAETPERRSPRGDGWTQLIDPVVGVSMWRHLTGVTVTSSVDWIEGDGPTWHIAVSQVAVSGAAVRAGRTAVRLARWAFHMEAAEEDNHAPPEWCARSGCPSTRPSASHARARPRRPKRSARLARLGTSTPTSGAPTAGPSLPLDTPVQCPKAQASDCSHFGKCRIRHLNNAPPGTT